MFCKRCGLVYNPLGGVDDPSWLSGCCWCGAWLRPWGWRWWWPIAVMIYLLVTCGGESPGSRSGP